MIRKPSFVILCPHLVASGLTCNMRTPLQRSVRPRNCHTHAPSSRATPMAAARMSTAAAAPVESILGRSTSPAQLSTLLKCDSSVPASVWPYLDVKFDYEENWVDSSFGVFSLSGHCPCDANPGGGGTRSDWWCNSGRRHRGHHWRGIRRRPWSGRWCDYRRGHWCRYRCRRGAAGGWLPLLPGCLLSTAARRSVARCFA